MGKKGLSGTITTVLVILLVIVSVGIVWTFLSPFISDSISSISTEAYSVDMQVRTVIIEYADDVSNVSIGIYRKVGEGNVTGVNIGLTDVDGNTQVVKNSTAFDELETKKIIISYDSSNFNLASISIAPIFKGSNGKEVFGNVVDNYKLKGDEIKGLGLNIILNSPNDLDYLSYSGFDIDVSVIGVNPSCSYELKDFYTGYSAGSDGFTCDSTNGGKTTINGKGPGRYILTVSVNNVSDNDEKKVTIDLVGNYVKLNDFNVTSDVNGADLIIGTTGDYGDDSFSFADFNRDLVLWMPMDEVDGNNLPYDLSSYSNDAKTSINTVFIPGKFGNAVNFNLADSNNITVGNGSENSLNFSLNTPFTVMAWVRADASDNSNRNDKYIFSDLDSQVGWSLIAQPMAGTYHRLVFGLIDKTGETFSCYKNDNGVGRFDLTSGEWHLVVGVFDGTDVNCFVSDPTNKDGLNKGQTASGPPGDFSNTKPIIIRWGGSENTNSLQGEIDNVMIFNRALTMTEINSMFVDGNDYSSIHSIDTYNVRGYAGNSLGEYAITDILQG